MSSADQDERAPEVDSASRKRAMVVLLVAMMLAVLAWLFLGRATDAGLERLSAIDRVRVHCDSLIAGARSQNDSARIAVTPLPDTIDADSDKAMRTCSDLRTVSQ